MYYFARISGFLLLPGFGGIALVASLHEAMVADLETRIRREGRPAFVTLNRAQEVSTPLGGRYYYSYSGYVDRNRIRGLEEVPRELFHVLSEGKNVQVLVYRDPSGAAHIRLRDGSLPYGRRLRLLKNLSLALAGLGALLLIFAFARKRISGPGPAYALPHENRE